MPAPDFATLTNEIIAAVDANPGAPELPWRRLDLRLPANAVTKSRYRGVNVLSLWAGAMRHSFQTPIWASYRQWAAIGAQVRQGEKGTSIIYYQDRPADSDSTDADSDHARRPLVRSSVLFNADQTTGYKPPAPPPPPSPWDRDARTDRFIDGTGALIRYGGDDAYYSSAGDFIQLPKPDDFIGTTTSSARDGFYATTLHELAHWTGAKKRLNRDLSGRFGSASYAMEELVAELAAAFACAELEITPALRLDHAKYIRNWLAVLREDSRAIAIAAGNATRAVDYLRGLQPSAAADTTHGHGDRNFHDPVHEEPLNLIL